MVENCVFVRYVVFLRAKISPQTFPQKSGEIVNFLKFAKYVCMCKYENIYVHSRS